MYSRNEMKKWITDVKDQLLDAESNYMFHMVPTETVESLLVILEEAKRYIDMTETLKAVLGRVRLQDESDPDQTVRMIIEKIEKGETSDETE